MKLSVKCGPSGSRRQDVPAKWLPRLRISVPSISATIGLANGRREYLPKHNGRFARAAAKAEEYHRRAPRAAELDRILCLENERTISNDWVVRYQNRWFQLAPMRRQSASAQDRVLVCKGRHGKIAIEYRKRTLRWQEISARRQPIKIESKAAVKPATEPKPPRVQREWVPPSNHPWREAARRGEQERARKLAAIAAGSSLALPSAAP